MRLAGLSLISAVVLGSCAGVTHQSDALSVLLERSTHTQPQLTAYEQAKQYLSVGSLGLAVDAFQRELARNPNSIPALNGLAVAYDRLGRSDAARQILDKALTLDSNSAVTLNNLAYLNLTQGDHDVALSYAERAKAAARNTAVPLSGAVAEAVTKNLEIATQLAQRAPSLPELEAQNSRLKRVSDNEWELKLPEASAPSAASALPSQSAPESPSRLPTSVKAPYKLKEGSIRPAVLPVGYLLRVSNGTGRSLMARRFAEYLRRRGLSVGEVANAKSFDYKRSAVYYNPDQSKVAARLARMLPFPVTLAEASRGRGRIEIILGTDTISFDKGLLSR